MAELLETLGSAPLWIAVLRIATPLILGTLGVLLCAGALWAARARLGSRAGKARGGQGQQHMQDNPLHSQRARREARSPRRQ